MDARLDRSSDVRLAIVGRQHEKPGDRRHAGRLPDVAGEAQGMAVVGDDDVDAGSAQARGVDRVV
jgi:hypothetical protein